MHRFYSYCAQLIGGMIVCLLIISFSVTLTLNFRPLYYADIQHLHIAELSADTMFAQQEQQASSFQKQQVLKSIAFLQEARAADSRLQAALPAMRLTF